MQEIARTQASREQAPSPDAQPGTFGEKFQKLRVTAEADRSADNAPPAPLPAVPNGGKSWLGEPFVIGLLYVLGCLVAAVGVLGGLYRLSLAAERGMVTADVLEIAGWIVGGLALAAVLVVIAALLGALHQLRRQIRDSGVELDRLAERVERLGHLAVDPAVLDRLEDRLGNLNESVVDVAHNALLDEAGRTEKRRQFEQHEREDQVQNIRREMSAGHWDRARHAIERFRMNFPGENEQTNRLAEELDNRRGQAENEDVAATRRQCEELMSVSAWDRAIAAAGELLAKHPDSTAAKSLLSRVERERKVAAEQQRAELYVQIQRCTSRRQWSEALKAAGRLIDTFPNSIEAEAVKAQMDTLAENAEIQHRQKIELTIKDMVKRQRFAEAIELAEEIIRDYPQSPQAAALRDQLPRLKERAEEAAREARKRKVKWD